MCLEGSVVVVAVVAAAVVDFVGFVVETCWKIVDLVRWLYDHY